MGKGRKGQEIIIQILCLHRRQKVKIQDGLPPLLMQPQVSLGLVWGQT